ncbi:kinase-like domain-containing protein [Trichoderma austrokoningii]
MSSVQQKPKKRQAAASSQSISPSETQAKPHITKVDRSHDELYESTQLATQSDSPPEIRPDPSAAKAGESPVDQVEAAEEPTQLASSLPSGPYPEAKIELSRGGPADDKEDEEATQLASLLQPSSPSPPSEETRQADNNDAEEPTQLASSLQSISSSQRKELKSRIKEARVRLFQDSRKESTSLQAASSAQTESKYPVAKNDDKSLEEIFGALEMASHFMPEARLVIRSLYSSKAKEIEDYSIRYPPAKDAYQNIFGVIQSRNHTDFTFQTPLYLHIPKEAPRPVMEHRLHFQFIYDPTSDDCLLINKSFGWESFLSVSTSPLKRIEIRGSQLLQPGMWMISVKAQASSQYYTALAILIAPRQFSISVYSENISVRSKRAIEGDEGLAKRQRLNDGKSKIAVESSDLVDKANKNSFLHNHKPREIYNKTISPILDLTDGEVAAVEVSVAGPANPENKYQLQRIKNIVKLQATSVFTCQHSKVAGDVVAKVLRYSSDSIYNLVGISRSWKQEKRALSNLHHRNIVSLKAFDGRAFAFYLEHLPPSLNAVRESPFHLSDAKTILRDISSALAYLSKQEIIHYDIKPANIAYSRGRGAVLMDFGMADSVATIKKPHGGTPWFIPPDILKGMIRGFPGDIWALGITMLLVLGKIALPSSLGQPVYIHKLLDEESYSHKQTIAWFAVVERVRRNNLNLKDEVERLVFEMLHEDGLARVGAETIELALREKKMIA